MKMIFKRMDTSGDGVVTTKELGYFLRQMENGLRITPASVNTIIRKVDVDKDGKISFEEFESALTGILQKFQI